MIIANILMTIDKTPDNVDRNPIALLANKINAIKHEITTIKKMTIYTASFKVKDSL